jgi:Methyltransferase FkbM domain
MPRARGLRFDGARLIKLDIEGAEEKALRGGTSILGEEGCPYIVLELNVEALPKFGSSPESVCGFMREWGYEPFLLHANGSLPTYLPRRTHVIPNRLNWNVLFSTFDMVGAAWPEIGL